MSKSAHVLISVVAAALVSLSAVFFAGCSPSEDWVRNTIRQNYYRADGDYSSLGSLDGLSIDEMVKKLDIYSGYYTGSEYARILSSNQGHKSGIGISYSQSDGGIVIRSVLGGSPAASAGLKAGDIIVSISSGGKTMDSSGDIASFISGLDEGTDIVLTLSGGRQVTLRKLSYTASYVSMYTSDARYSFWYDGSSRRISQEEGGVEELPVNTAYVRLDQFYGSATEEMRELIKIFNARGCTSLILDLRDNGGGYASVLTEIGGLFTSATHESSVAMRAVYKSGRTEITNCKHYTQDVLPAGTDVYVMANDGTASASEALIGILVSYGISDYGNIFLSDYGDRPARTYGKGIMQSHFINYTTGEVLKLTVAGIFWQNGKTIHGTGLTVADGCVAAPAGDDVVDIGYDDELLPVIQKINGGKPNP